MVVPPMLERSTNSSYAVRVNIRRYRFGRWVGWWSWWGGGRVSRRRGHFDGKGDFFCMGRRKRRDGSWGGRHLCWKFGPLPLALRICKSIRPVLDIAVQVRVPRPKGERILACETPRTAQVMPMPRVKLPDFRIPLHTSELEAVAVGRAGFGQDVAETIVGQLIQDRAAGVYNLPDGA